MFAFAEIGLCDSVPCKNSGLCTETADGLSFSCDCADGWEGTFCELGKYLSGEKKKNTLSVISHRNSDVMFCRRLALAVFWAVGLAQRCLSSILGRGGSHPTKATV